MITPVIPPQAPLQELLYGPLLSPVLAKPANDDVMYGMSTVGEAGRILDRRLTALLGWVPGTRLTIRCSQHSVLIVSPSPDGAAVMTSQEFFRVHYKLRRRVCLFIGDRVFLVARKSRNQLLVHTPSAMDELFAPSLRLLEV